MIPIRTFIAVALDDRLKRELSRLQTRLAKADDAAAVRWTTPKTMHLTLCFLGDILPTALDAIEDAMDNVACDFPPFHMDIGELNAFPDRKNPRIIWAGVTKRANILANIASHLSQEMADLPVLKEDRGFKPHITLGRLQTLAAGSTLPAALEKITVPSGLSQKVDHITLFRSELLARGAMYSILHTTALRK